MDFYSLLMFLFIAIALILYYKVMKSRQWICLLIFSMCYYAMCGISGAVYIFITAISTYLIAIKIENINEKYKRLRKGLSVLPNKKTKSLKEEFGERKEYRKFSKEESGEKADEKTEVRKLTKEEKAILKTKNQKEIRKYLILDLLINLGILLFVKCGVYTGSLLLPLGISFYTFSSIAYLVDVYNKKIRAEKNFGKLLLFLSYFPQIIQGPINRFDKMRPQYDKVHTFNYENFKSAIWLFLFGALKKYAIADMLVDTIGYIFDNGYEGVPGSLIVFGILLYSAQQYADFSGGIDMAFAISKMFDIDMMVNFKRPYFATSLGDFWRRWHISLGAFMRDYVFYPFALLKPMQSFGKWCSKHLGKHFGRVLPAGIANILVFFLVGIWHGFEMHYVAWGLYNGIVIALSDITQPFWEKKIFKIPHIHANIAHVLRVIRTFIIVNIGWYFDRITNISDCIYFFRNTFLYFAPKGFADMFQTKVLGHVEARYLYGGYAVAAFAILFVFADSLYLETGHERERLYSKMPVAIKYLVYTYMIFLILASFMFTQGSGGFMYANF